MTDLRNRSSYRVYLLTIWHETSLQPGGLHQVRYRLEDSVSRCQLGFSSADELVAALEALSTDDAHGSRST